MFSYARRTGVMVFGLVLAAGLACGRARADETSPAKEAPPLIARPSSTPPATPQDWDFSHCTATLADDPDGARDYAEDWRSHGGGLEAEQCAALAQMELGDVATAATELDRLAHVPDWPAGPPANRRGSRQNVAETPASRLRRASVAQAAARAWQADDSPKQAFDSATYGLMLAPDDPGLKLVYARVAVELGQPQRAIDMLTPLPSAPAARDEALVARAAAWRKLGRIDQGMADINAALHDMPHNGAALLERGILYQRQGQMEQARADWLDVVKQAPDSDEADLARQDLALLETDPEAP
ncbi:tetratricopeptide repeat protein [Komagataeibacter xylinus]|uniref:tetratricopeptide repeat protein n=1 Tax=Komagataeibacter xylinus TaxID=28448 RepID=UPI001F0E7C32|nr:tetratricopeptide repeat protein [Komagataeibacter xylinus]